MPNLFDILEGEIVDIVDFSIAHHKRTGDAPTLAVNANSWWHANLTDKAVQTIQGRVEKKNNNDRTVEINIVESNIFYYTLRILHLGIRLHFVFDNPNQLNNGRRSARGKPPSPLLRDILTRLAIPWHTAPGKAEAECAKMEMDKIVDAVWSEDGNALAFGCQTLIRFHHVIKLSTDHDQKKKSPTHFRVYNIQDIAKKYPRMDRSGFILHAVLAERNGGLPGFGPKDVLRAVRDGLGISLDAASRSEPEIQEWVDTKLKSYLSDVGIDTAITIGFRAHSRVRDCTAPEVSTRDTILKIITPQEQWNNEEDLFKFIARIFDPWNIQRWARWIVPLRVIRALLATENTNTNQHGHLKLKGDLKKNPKRPTVTFLLCNATSLDLSKMGGEDRSYIEAPIWIIRRARPNGFSFMDSYLTPKSAQSARPSPSGISSGGNTIVNASTLTPPTQSHTHPGVSLGTQPVRRRQVTPPSPSPAPRRMSVAAKLGARATKSIHPVAKDSHEQPVHSGSSKDKGKARGIQTGSKEVLKRKRPSSVHEQTQTKRAKVVIDLTSSSTDSTQPSKEFADCMLISSQSDDDYGSVPNSQDLQELPSQLGFKRTSIDPSDSEATDEFGSFPSSPDLRVILDP